MASVEVFCRNVRAILTQRNIRVKDLAERIGISESYLSLFLTGSRRNLSDEFKDRIAAYLGLSMSRLYSEDFGATLADPGPIFVEDPGRLETVRVVEAFVLACHLEHLRHAFYTILAKSSDREASTVRALLTGVLSELARGEARSEAPEPTMTSLSQEERFLLAVCSMAGDGANLDWVRSASGVAPDRFDRLISSLVARKLIGLIDDVNGLRVSLMVQSVPVLSILSAARVRDTHLELAAAMETLTDKNPYAEKMIAEHLVEGGSTARALDHYVRAARLMEGSSLWHDAAEAWHRASVLCSIVGDKDRRANCLADAAKCMCVDGDFRQASEFGAYACRLCQEMGNARAVANVCIMMGNILREKDIDSAIEWYRRGIKAVPPEAERGRLLINLASALLEAARLDEAENTLKETLRWAAGREPEEVASINCKVSLSLGLIEYQRRNWKKARSHFESCLEQAEAADAPLDTVWHNLGMLMYREDNMKKAKEYLAKAQDLYSERGDKLSWAYAAIELAKVALREGDLDGAKREVRSAEPCLEEKSLHEKGWLLLIRACIDRGQRRLNQAIENGRKAIDIFQREGADRDLACAALWLSSLYTEAGDLQQATSLERRAFQIYEKKHWDVRELHRERSLLEPAEKPRRDDG